MAPAGVVRPSLPRGVRDAYVITAGPVCGDENTRLNACGTPHAWLPCVPAVSIIVPCHARRPEDVPLLEETLNSVRAQTWQDYELIVVDDGSPQDVSALVTAQPRTTLVRQANAGPAVARNAGLAVARGEYLVFLDADDHLLPPALEAGIGALASSPACDFAVGAREEMTYEGQPVEWTVSPPPDQEQLYLPLLAFEWYIIPPSSAIFRREAVQCAGGFRDPWGADDLDFYLRVAYGCRARCYPSPAVTRYRRYSASSSRDGERMLRSVREVYARQWPLVQGDAEGEAAFHRGLAALIEIFRDCLVENVQDRLASGDDAGAARAARLLAEESPARWERLQQRIGDRLQHAGAVPPG